MELDNQNVKPEGDEVQNADETASDFNAGPDGRIFSVEEIEENLSLLEPVPETKYSVDSSQQFSQYLSKDVSSRYRAIVLNAWVEKDETPHYDVGLVHIKNADHRNGVIHALRVTPAYVNFIALDEAFFEYMHSHIYDAQTQVRVLEHKAKKQSQKTKKWGEGKTSLTAEEAYVAQATSDADLQNQSEEWIDLTDK